VIWSWCIVSKNTACVFQAYSKSPGQYFLAQCWNSGTPQIHSAVECDGLRFDTAHKFYSTAYFDMQTLIIHIWSHSRHTSEPWIPALHYLWICGCQHTECHLSVTKPLGAGAAHPTRTQSNIWIYAWLLCHGCDWNAITVMLCVNQSIGGRCQLHIYHRFTALGDW
jgi:hypothetical protein